MSITGEERSDCEFCGTKLDSLANQVVSCRSCLDYLEVEGKKDILDNLEHQIEIKTRELNRINEKIKWGHIHPKFQKIQLNLMRVDVYDELRYLKGNIEYYKGQYSSYKYKVESLHEFIENLAPLMKKKEIIQKLNQDIRHLNENKEAIIKRIEDVNQDYNQVQLEFYSDKLINDIEPRYYFEPESEYSREGGFFYGWVMKDRDAFLGLLKTCGLSNRESDPKFIHAIKRDPKTCENCSRRALVRVTYLAMGGHYSIPLCAHCIITNMRKQLNEYFYKLFEIFY